MCRINALTGNSYSLVKHLKSGHQSGAWIVSDGDQVACLKWSPGTANLARQRAAATTCERLRLAGSPVPRYHVIDAVDGDSFALMDFIEGHPVLNGGLTAAQARHLVELIELQAGCAVLSPGPSDRITRYLLDDDRARVRAHSPESAEVLDRVQAIATELRDIRLPSGDAVHGDMNPGNLIVDRESGELIAGIVDWDSAATGDRATDLATILFYLWDPLVHEVLWDGLVAITTEETLRLHIAGLACWALDSQNIDRAVRLLDHISA